MLSSVSSQTLRPFPERWPLETLPRLLDEEGHMGLLEERTKTSWKYASVPSEEFQ